MYYMQPRPTLALMAPGTLYVLQSKLNSVCYANVIKKIVNLPSRNILYLRKKFFAMSAFL
jgi:hypothetical protein